MTLLYLAKLSSALHTLCLSDMLLISVCFVFVRDHSCRRKTVARAILLCCSPRLRRTRINQSILYLHVLRNSECFEQHFSASSAAFTMVGTTFFAANASSFSSMCASFTLFMLRGSVIRMSLHLDQKVSDMMMSSIVGRFSSLFCRQLFMIFWNSGLTQFGKGVNFSFKTLFFSSSISVAYHGNLCTQSSYKITPRAHMSEPLVFGLSNQSSGAR